MPGNSFYYTAGFVEQMTPQVTLKVTVTVTVTVTLTLTLTLTLTRSAPSWPRRRRTRPTSPVST